MKSSRSISGQYFGDDAPAGGIYNPVNLNSYQYASNNPVRYTDPTGKWSWGVHTIMSSVSTLVGSAIRGEGFGEAFTSFAANIFIQGVLMDGGLSKEESLHSTESSGGGRELLLAITETIAFGLDFANVFVENKNLSKWVFSLLSGVCKGVRDHILQDMFSHELGENANNHGDRSYLSSRLIGTMSLSFGVGFLLAGGVIEWGSEEGSQGAELRDKGFGRALLKMGAISSMIGATYLLQIAVMKNHGNDDGVGKCDRIAANFGQFTKATLATTAFEAIHSIIPGVINYYINGDGKNEKN